MEEKATKYWNDVLTRVVAIVKFLNYITILRMETSSDALIFLSRVRFLLNEHIRNYGNSGTGNVSYLYSTTYEKFTICWCKVLDQITSEFKEAKYYGISIDSIPCVKLISCQSSFIIKRWTSNDCTY
jgi:hypothetical protein